MKSSNTYLLSLFLLCSVTLWGCDGSEPAVEADPFVMVTQPQTQGTQVKSYAGSVKATQQTSLAFRVNGQITERYVDVGDRVRVGQVLAKLDAQDAQLQSNAAKAQLESAQSAAKIAQEEYKRFQQLLPINAVSRSQFDAVKNQYEASQAALKQAQSNYAVTSNQTRYNQLVAKRNGIITQRNIEVGQVISAGQPAYELAMDGDREVVIGVAEQAISTIKVGQPAWVTLWSKPNDQFAAVVREISPAADQSRTFSVKVALKEGQSQFQIGQSARVFFSNQVNQAIYIPLSSVSASEKQPYVWVVNPDQSIRKVQVKLGAYGRDQVQVLEGLNAQDWVVVGGVHLLRAKQKIKPVDRENRAVDIKPALPKQGGAV